MKKLLIISMCFITLGFSSDFNLQKFSKSEKKSIDVLLLLALPGAGKSEVRKFMKSFSKKECEVKFKIKETVQLDDFPYVHMMRRISEEMVKLDQFPIFFRSGVCPFIDAKDWGTLIHLLNEDYDDLIYGSIPSVNSAADWLLERFDRARLKSGIDKSFAKLPLKVKKQLSLAIEKDAKKLLDEKTKEIKKGSLDKTVVIEFARGGAYGSKMPLPSPYGYQYALSQLSDDILQKSNILYVWLSPEESRRKNEKRADPNNPGSILHHSVPLSVMYNDYGLDDFEYLMNNSKITNAVQISAHNRMYTLPVAKLDNRKDKTSFVRDSSWKKENIMRLDEALIKAFKPIVTDNIVQK